MEELERRLRARATDSRETVARRLELAKKEMESAGAYDYRVVNDDLGEAIAQVKRILSSEE